MAKESSSPPPVGAARIRRTRVSSAHTDAAPEEDYVAIEEPLGVRVQGHDYAVLMCTPGREEDLACGFLAAEGLLSGSEDLAAVAPCVPRAGEEDMGRMFNVALAPGVAFDPSAHQSRMVASSCGLCGGKTVADLRQSAPHRTPAPPAQLAVSDLLEAFRTLQKAQDLFALTAGCHGAALVRADAKGPLHDVAEDVGRHNAVDKLLGARLRAGDYPLAEPTALLVSGRLSYELVQKAVLAGLSWIAGVGMPSSLAIEAAEATQLGLFAWVRDAGVSAYAGRTQFVMT